MKYSLIISSLAGLILATPHALKPSGTKALKPWYEQSEWAFITGQEPYESEAGTIAWCFEKCWKREGNETFESVKECLQSRKLPRGILCLNGIQLGVNPEHPEKECFRPYVENPNDEGDCPLPLPATSR